MVAADINKHKPVYGDGNDYYIIIIKHRTFERQSPEKKNVQNWIVSELWITE